MPASSPDPSTDPAADSRDPRTVDHRARLAAGMAAAIRDLGYAGLRIDDVVRYAHVSKRTFYEHFASKEDALLAVYEAESARVLAAVDAALRTAPPGAARVEAGTAVYLAALQAGPGLVRTVLVEILHIGARGLEVRRTVMRRFADLLLHEMEAAGVRAAVSPAIAMALVGGINELVLEAIEEDRVDRLVELAAPVAALVRAFVVPDAARETSGRTVRAG